MNDLFDAMRKRHSYGATDNIILDYRMQASGKEYLQGDIVNAPGEFKLIVKVVGTMPIRQIDIVKNNKFLHNRQPLEKEASFTFVDNQAGRPNGMVVTNLGYAVVMSFHQNVSVAARASSPDQR